MISILNVIALTMQNSIFKGIFSILFTIHGHSPPFKEVLLSHVMTSLERQSDNSLASDSMLFCQNFIVLALIFDLV